MKTFADRLFEKVAQLDNPTVLGLDPQLAYIPDSIRLAARAHGDDPALCAAAALSAFNCRLVDATCDLIGVVKLQSAYYEMYGHHGVRAFADTIAYARARGMLVIADCKRNDIGSTAEAYATAYLGQTDFVDGRLLPMFDADALTINPYLGIDGVEPFIRACKNRGKGLFVLVRTSNPSAGDFQDLVLDTGEKVYERVGDRVAEWGRFLVGPSGYSPIGAVVGATWPEQARALRQRLPHVPFLVPGYGAQGADAVDLCASFDQRGLGAVINASRSLMCAYRRHAAGDAEQFESAARREAIRMRDEIRQAQTTAGKRYRGLRDTETGKGPA